MLDDFMVRAVLSGMGIVLATGPLGCFVVWRRMAYFGDATSHAAILGVAIALAFGMSIYVGTLAVALAMAVIVSVLAGRGHSMDTLLGVLAHLALAAGLIAVAFVPDARLDLQSFLFGDILAVQPMDVAVSWIGGLFVLGLLASRWQQLVTATVNEELAVAAGIDPARARLILSIALALVVAVAIRIVGALLISALLIIPAATARIYARTPEAMAVAATGIGLVSVLAGLASSLYLDTPAGPSIVGAAGVCFALSLGLRRAG